MEKSDHYYLRKERMRSLEAPKMSEVKRELGEEIADALFSQCPDALKPVVGLTPTLKGAGDDLWISPSDLLISKVCLKPPLTTKYMKALTHEGILMIGRDVEIKFWNQAMLDKQRALEEQEEMLLFVAERAKRKAVEEARKQEQEKCRREKEEMRLEFEARLKYELEQLENKLREEYDDLMKLREDVLNQQWQEKLEAAVAETITRLTQQFLEDLEKQEKELLRKFAVEIKKEELKRKMDIKAIQQCCQETYLQLKHQLECKNIANMMYILCMERRKCQHEYKNIETNYQKQVQDLQEVVTEKEVEISRLIKEYDEKVQQVHLREECLLEILRQFQKFINFALRASPTQAEFLLNVEKMMMFELTEALANTDRQHAKRLARILFSWKSDSGTKTTESTNKSVTLDDHHQCYNEIEPPQSRESVESGDYLPAFHYDKHMYVREEFRNMMSQGIEISPSNLIWNRDVEHLMHILKRSATNIQEEEQEEEVKEQTEDKKVEEVVQEEEEEKPKKKDRELGDKGLFPGTDSPVPKKDSLYARSHQPRRSIVYFREDNDGQFLFPEFSEYSSEILEVIPSDLVGEMSIQTGESLDDINMVLEKECCKPCATSQTVDRKSDMDRHAGRLALLAAQNSLGSSAASKEEVTRGSDHFETSGGILCAHDSLIKHRMSLKPTTNRALTSRESIVPPDRITLSRKSKRTNSDSSQNSRKQSNQNQREPKKHIQSSLTATSKDSKKYSRLNENDENLSLSKLSLSRNSYLVHKQHKHSLLSKQQPRSSLTYESDKLRSSQETIQLCKPIKPILLRDTPDRASLKRPSKYRGSYETRSCTLSPLTSLQLDQLPKELPFPTSKLTMSRDSLDLLRSQSKISEMNRIKRKHFSKDSKESIEIKDGILGAHLQSSRVSPPVIKLDDNGSKVVKMSHIEIVPLEYQNYEETYEEDQSTVCSVFKDDIATTTDSPWLVYDDKELSIEDLEKPPELPRDNFLEKPNMAQIVGDKKATEYMQKDEEFTLHRASSFLTIFRKHPSLVKIFTPCTK